MGYSILDNFEIKTKMNDSKQELYQNQFYLPISQNYHLNHSIYKVFRFLMSDIHIVQQQLQENFMFHFNELYVLKSENIEHAYLKMNFNKYFQAGHDKMKSTRQLINPIAEAA